MEHLMKHIEAICKDNNIIMKRHSGKRSRAFHNYKGSGRQKISVKRINSYLTYAVAMHELGHLLGPHQCSCDVLKRETGAWLWAMENCKVWMPCMKSGMIRRLRSYLKAKGEPDAEHIIWHLVPRN